MEGSVDQRRGVEGGIHAGEDEWWVAEEREA